MDKKADDQRNIDVGEISLNNDYTFGESINKAWELGFLYGLETNAILEQQDESKPETPIITRWEYRYEFISDDYEDILDGIGSEGWELVSFQRDHYVFKRPIK